MSDRQYEDDGPRPSLWHRIIHGTDDAPIGERFRAAVLKPADPASTEPAPPDERSVDELKSAERYADDKERMFGLAAAPLAAAIGFFIANYQIQNDPPARLNGAINPLHTSVATLHTLELVLLVLSLVILATAWYRKRLFLGMAMALYGLGVFNLHYWGFGIPFLLGGAWLLVRSYRAHQAVRDATGQGRGAGGGAFSRPKANKRYTPPL